MRSPSQNVTFTARAGAARQSPLYWILWVRGSEAIPFPGAFSMFSSPCRAISGRPLLTVSQSRTAISADAPRFRRSTVGIARVGLATRRTPRFGWPAASGWGGQNGGFDGTVQVGGLLKGGGVRTKVVHFCITGKRLFLGRLGV